MDEKEVRMNFVITIARGFGSGGRSIGNEVAKKLGIRCYEKEILEMASAESGISQTLFEETDEKLRGGYLLNRLRSLPHDEVITPVSKKFVSDNNLFNIQKKILNDLIKEESFVVVGKCADSVMELGTPMLRVYIDAPFMKCVKTVMKRMEVSNAQAQEMVISTNKYRADYYKYYTGGKDWREPLNYDLFLNTEMLSVESCAQIIVEAFKKKYKIA